MNEALAAQDAALRVEADALLARAGLRELLGSAGTLHIAGSYALRLMTWRDLDLYLEAPGLMVTRFFALGTRIAERLDPWKMSFMNNRARAYTDCPPGLYWGIRLGDVRAGAWKIDLWAMEPDACRAAVEHGARIASRLTPEARQIILALKSQLWRHPEYRDTITSQIIYDAVLDGGVADLDGFWAYARRLPTAPAP